MKIVDTQWHEPAPVSEWQPDDVETRRALLTELLFANMNAVGVDAVLIFPLEDRGWPMSLAAAHPDRFAWVPMVTAADAPGDPDLPIRPDAPDLEDQIAALAEDPGCAAVRILAAFFEEEVVRHKAGGNERALAACEKYGLPVYFFCSGEPELAAPVAEKYPDLTMVIDHLGVRQPPLEEPDDPWYAKFPDVLALAKYPKVTVKLAGSPVFSKTGWPYRDTWPQIREVVDAFGADRVMWASDASRFSGRIGWSMRVEEAMVPYPGKHNYAESLSFVRDTDLLSDEEKGWVLGGSSTKWLNWPADGGA
ncbi:MAG: amidohydrolase family protein [Acidimicrobiales bacterium]